MVIVKWDRQDIYGVLLINLQYLLLVCGTSRSNSWALGEAPSARNIQL